VQQAVFQFCIGHFDMVGKAEATLKRAFGNTAMQELTLDGFIALGDFAGHGQGVFLNGDVQVVF